MTINQFWEQWNQFQRRGGLLRSLQIKLFPQSLGKLILQISRQSLGGLTPWGHLIGQFQLRKINQRNEIKRNLKHRNTCAPDSTRTWRRKALQSGRDYTQPGGIQLGRTAGRFANIPYYLFIPWYLFQANNSRFKSVRC